MIHAETESERIAYADVYTGRNAILNYLQWFYIRYKAESEEKIFRGLEGLLRDFGELLMIRLYGHGNLPEEFRSFYRILLDYDSRFNNLDKEDIRGAFTEVFMLAVIDRAPKFAGPYAETPAKVTHQCYRYISSLFRGRALDEQERG